jgi:4-diphosphocytidyl-2-C-methyl-D-erythritol kinase
MRLTKRIPAGAGLGGGSSDAAAALLGVNALANNAVPRAELFNMAHRLGADVPFFLSEAPLALAWGRGQRLLRLPPLDPHPMLLVIPETPVVTAEAYQWVDEVRQQGGVRGAVAFDLDVLSRWSDVARLAGNDFESPVFGRIPTIRAAFDALARTRPILCRMTGSGSALFAIYRNARDRDDAAMQLGSKHGRLIATLTG